VASPVVVNRTVPGGRLQGGKRQLEISTTLDPARAVPSGISTSIVSR
jgi:hypothetical protein